MSPKKKLIAIRASDMTLKQLDELGQALGMNQTEILTLAIDRLYQKVTMPLGWLAGKEVDLPRALQDLAAEMLGHRADLREKARRQPQEAEILEAHASDLERYALALWLLWWQTEEPTQREQRISGGLAGWLEIASRLSLALPAELETQARKDASKKTGAT